jgi:predicted RNase H-like HicB family nuclease
MSDGETEAEAIENAHDAINAWIAHATADGRPAPAPRRQYRDV